MRIQTAASTSRRRSPIDGSRCSIDCLGGMATSARLWLKQRTTTYASWGVRRQLNGQARQTQFEMVPLGCGSDFFWGSTSSPIFSPNRYLRSIASSRGGFSLLPVCPGSEARIEREPSERTPPPGPDRTDRPRSHRPEPSEVTPALFAPQLLEALHTATGLGVRLIRSDTAVPLWASENPLCPLMRIRGLRVHPARDCASPRPTVGERP
jgi:hypothetical protein